MKYIALEEAFSIPELTDRQPPSWPANRFSQRHLADWARKLPDFTGYRLPEMDAAGIDVQVPSLTVPGLQADIDAPATSGVFSPAALTCAVLEIGADAVMFSVDYPYESSHEAVAGLEQTTLSVSDREKIAHGNAERILRL
jgi:predicted TIM-barrel fold metal-dependent hydrolase